MQTGNVIMADRPPSYLPSHGINPRKIDPTKVIEEFGLTYHLAWVVKYIASARYKTSILKDLQKATKHLDREIKRHQAGMFPCFSSLGKKPLFSISEILEDWKLTPNLRKSLFHILHSCQLPPTSLERGLFPGRGSVRLFIKSKDFFYHTLPLIKSMRFLNLEIAELRMGAIERGDSL
jgi:hypothetical protein